MRPRLMGRFVVALVVMLGLGLGGYHVASGSPAKASRLASQQPKYGGVLTQGFQNDLATLDPAIAYDWDNWPVVKMVFDGLLDYNSGTKIVPRIAARMPKVTDGGRVYTFSLRHNVHFTNGRLVTAADAAYTINRVLSPATKSPGASFYLDIKGAPQVVAGKAKTASGIKVLNKFTVQFTLIKPDVTFLNEMAMNFAYIVPKEVVQKEGANFGHKPVGTGPFIMKQWVPGQKIVFVRNPHYFIKGDPYLSGVTLEIGLNPSVALLRLQRGQLDMLGDPIPGPDFLSIKNNPKYKNMLVREVEPETSYIAMNTRMKPFNNVLVRRAINMAIDKRRIVQLLNGRGVVANQVLPPLMPGYNPHYKGYPYNPAAAKKLLAKAGYPHGFSTQLYTLNVDPQPRIAESFQADLQQIGVKASVVPLSQATIVQKAGTPGKVPMIWSGGLAWLQDFPDPSDFYGPILGCGSAVQGGWNWPFFCDRTIDAQANKLLGMNNRTKRLAGYRSMYNKVMQQAPWVPVDNDVKYVLHGPQVHGPYWAFVHNVHTFFYEHIWKS